MAGLPTFDGRKVVGSRLKVNGLSASGVEILKGGQRLILLVEVEVTEIDHQLDAKVNEYVRVHKAQIQRHMPFPNQSEGAMLLDAEEDARLQAEEEAAGVARLPLSRLPTDEELLASHRQGLPRDDRVPACVECELEAQAEAEGD